LEFGLDAEGTGWLQGWSVYPTGENTNYWKNQTVTTMFNPILGCSSSSAMSEYTEYTYTNWGGETASSISILSPDVEDIYNECDPELLAFASESSSGPLGVKAFKKLKTSESTHESGQTSSTSSSSSSTTGAQKKRKADDK